MGCCVSALHLSGSISRSFQGVLFRPITTSLRSSISLLASITIPKNPSAKVHQEIYLRALQKLGSVEIVEGYYQRQDAKMSFRFEPCKSCRPYADVVRVEEKRSDVNLATAMMVDFHEDKADSFVIISGDADLIAPIEYIRRTGGRNVVVFNPHQTISGDLKRHATFYKNIPRNLPAECRLPDEITYGSHSRVIRCPPAWLPER